MRLIIILGCVVATAAGCETTKCSTCGPCSKPVVSPCAPGVPAAPAAKPGAPTYLPPTIREVRGGAEDVSEPRTQPVSANQDVLLIPKWVYVPYTPHTPTGPTKLPGGMWNGQQSSPYMQVDERVTVLPPMGGAPMGAPMVQSQQQNTMEQCLQQMKMMNARLSDLEAKSAGRPVTASVETTGTPQMPQVPQMLPLPPPVISTPIPPAK